MRTNKAMKHLLNSLPQSSGSGHLNLFDPIFHEWDDCILIEDPSLEAIDAMEQTFYQDRTELEASINHYHIDNLETGIELLKNWEKYLKSNYPEKKFVLILSSTLAGEDVVIRFYQCRQDESEWMKRDDLEGYREEAILVIEILNVER